MQEDQATEGLRKFLSEAPKSENFKRAIETVESRPDTLSKRLKDYQENGEDSLLNFDELMKDRIES